MGHERQTMIYNVHGPMFEQLAEPPWPVSADIVIVRDHYDPVLLDRFLQQRPPQICLQSFYAYGSPLAFPVTWVPIFLKQVTEQMNRCAMPVNPDTQACFGFMIFKNRDLRTMAVEEIEQAGLTTDYYTLYLDPHMQGRFQHQHRHYPSRGPYHPSITYENNWQDFLQDRVFAPTAVNLIVETLEEAWGPAISFTEKSLFSVYGLCLPIWLGGHRQAETWQSLGFDVFADVIDHSYQYETDARTSMRRALADNHRILTDIKYAATIRQSCMSRLVANRDRLQSRPFGAMLIDLVAARYPDRVEEIRKHFRL